MRRISGTGYWQFLLSGPDPDPVNRLPDIRNPARAGYPEFGHMSDKIPIRTCCYIAQNSFFFKHIKIDTCNNDKMFYFKKRFLFKTSTFNFTLLLKRKYPESGGETKS